MTAENQTFEISERCLMHVNCSECMINVPDDIVYIGPEAFKDCKNAETIEIPDSVIQIAEKTFSGLSKLKSVRLSKNLTEIEAGLFSGCSSLEHIELPSEITTINAEAFKGCTSLRTILIPSSVKTIGNSCFTNCTSLENIQLDGVEEIGELAFAGCSVLGKIIFPESLKTLGAMAFKNCSHLEFVHFPDELLDVAPQMFVGCLHLNDIEVSEQAVFGKSVFLRALSADNWECFERRNGHCRRKLVNVMEYDPDGVFDLLPEGGAGLAELLPQRTLYVTLDAIWEYTQFDEEAYAFQIRILAVCMKIARCLTGSQMAALMSVVWHLRGLLLIWHIRHETSIEKVFPDALSATLNAVGGNGSNRIHNDALVRETFKLFLGSASDELKTAITSQIDHVLGIEGDFSRESPYDVRYTAGMGKPDYWIFSDVMGYLTRNKLGVHIPIPEVHSDDIEDWCAAWSRSLSDYHQNVILFELPPAKDEEENRHAVSVVSPEQVSMLLDVFREVGYHGCFVWTDGARMPFYLLDFIE